MVTTMIGDKIVDGTYMGTKYSIWCIMVRGRTSFYYRVGDNASLWRVSFHDAVDACFQYIIRSHVTSAN
jgi:hypothetical protein